MTKSYRIGSSLDSGDIYFNLEAESDNGAWTIVRELGSTATLTPRHEFEPSKRAQQWLRENHTSVEQESGADWTDLACALWLEHRNDLVIEASKHMEKGVSFEGYEYGWRVAKLKAVDWLRAVAEIEDSADEDENPDDDVRDLEIRSLRRVIGWQEYEIAWSVFQGF